MNLHNFGYFKPHPQMLVGLNMLTYWCLLNVGMLDGLLGVAGIIITLRLFNIAMENHQFL